MGFDPDAYLQQKTASASPAAAAGGFNPDAYLQEKTAAPEQESHSIGDNLRRMLHPSDQEAASDKQATMDAIQKQDEVSRVGRDATMNELTVGHLPQVKAKLGQVFSGEGIANDENYLQRRDQEIADEKAGAEKYPGAHMVGKAEGLAIPFLATMGGSAPASLVESAAPSLLKRLAVQGAKGAATGFAMGASQNPGDREGVVDPIQASERIQNGKTGAKWGGALGVTAAALPSIADAAEHLANTKAFKAAGAMLKDFRKANDKGMLEETGKFMFDNGLVKAGDDYSSIAERADSLRSETGKELGKGYEAAKKIVEGLNQAPEQIAAAGEAAGPSAAQKVAAAGFNPVRDKAEVLSAVAEELSHSPDKKSVLAHISNYLDDLAEAHGDQSLNPQLANQIKTKLDKVAINWERNPLAREPEKEAGYKVLRDYLSKKVNDQIDTIGQAIGNPDAAANLQELNRKYGIASRVSSIANDRASREEAKSAFGMGHMGATGIGASIGTAIGGPVGSAVGAGIGYASKTVGSKYGPAIAANVAKAAASSARVTPEIIKALTRSPELGELAASPLAPRVSAAKADPKNELDGDSSRSSNFQDNSKDQDMKSQPKASPTPKPSKGPDKWASDGADNIAAHEPDHGLDMDAALKDPKSKALLIAASDMKPKSKAMAEILSKLKSKQVRN